MIRMTLWSYTTLTDMTVDAMDGEHVLGHGGSLLRFWRAGPATHRCYERQVPKNDTVCTEYRGGAREGFGPRLPEAPSGACVVVWRPATPYLQADKLEFEKHPHL